MSGKSYEGSCLCGRVKLKVEGQPVAAGYCHCLSCRAWHSAPVNAWTVWPAAAVSIVDGAELVRNDYDHLGSNGTSARLWCRHCGSALANRKPRIDMMVVYAQTLRDSDFVFQPTLHVHYQERVLDMRDGLPKFADQPKAFGGSGELIDEPEKTAWRG